MALPRNVSAKSVAKMWSAPRLAAPHGSLAETGWLRARWTRRPVDREGSPIPWMTYGAIDLLDGLISSDTHVFEFGAGNSTLWLASRARHVISVEHDSAWIRQLRTVLPNNVTLLEAPATPATAYVDTWKAHGAGTSSAVIIDGRNRVECAREIATDGERLDLIAFDNSDRPRYREAIERLDELPMRKVVFRGLAPLLTSPTETTIYFR